MTDLLMAADVTRENRVRATLGDDVTVELKPWDAASLGRLLLARAAETGVWDTCGSNGGPGCGAPMFWAQTEDGKRRPVDVGNHPQGTAAIRREEGSGRSLLRYLAQGEELQPGERRVMPHHVSCPKRDNFRGQKRAPAGQR